jgi:hypothetical protein
LAFVIRPDLSDERIHGNILGSGAKLTREMLQQTRGKPTPLLSRSLIGLQAEVSDVDH